MPTYDPAKFIEGRYQPGAGGGATFPGAGQDQFDPEQVAGQIGQYYGTALKDQPTFDPIMRNISGVLGPDVKRQIGQAAAERGVGIGSYGGGADASGFLRALGLTSQQLTNTGIDQYLRSRASVPQLRPESLFVSPTERQRMNLQWAQSQADIQAALERQRESEAGAQTRAEIGQGTAFGTARIAAGTQAQRLQAEQAQAAQNRADTQAYQARIRADAAAQAEANRQAAWYGGTQAPGVTPGFGGGVLDPSVAAPAGGYDSVYGGLGIQDYGGSTGGIYFGEQFDTPQAEYDYLAGGGGAAPVESYYGGGFGYDVGPGYEDVSGIGYDYAAPVDDFGLYY
jgi:hypothetical protein